MQLTRYQPANAVSINEPPCSLILSALQQNMIFKLNIFSTFIYREKSKDANQTSGVSGERENCRLFCRYKSFEKVANKKFGDLFYSRAQNGEAFYGN